MGWDWWCTGWQSLLSGVAVVLGSCRQIRGQADFWSLHHFSADSSVLYCLCKAKSCGSLTSCGQGDGVRVDGLGGSESDEAGEDDSNRGGREHFGLMCTESYY